jgi:hypothetical protein
MITGILQNTPSWVWGVFVLLLVLGLLQTRRRSVSRFLVFVLPLDHDPAFVLRRSQSTFGSLAASRSIAWARSVSLPRVRALTVFVFQRAGWRALSG